MDDLWCLWERINVCREKSRVVKNCLGHQKVGVGGWGAVHSWREYRAMATVGGSRLRFRTRPWMVEEFSLHVSEVSWCLSYQNQHPQSDFSWGRGEAASGDFGPPPPPFWPVTELTLPKDGSGPLTIPSPQLPALTSFLSPPPPWCKDKILPKVSVDLSHRIKTSVQSLLLINIWPAVCSFFLLSATEINCYFTLHSTSISLGFTSSVIMLALGLNKTL